MSKRCDVCDKGPLVGNNISHSHVKTKRRTLPNLQKVRVKLNGGVRVMRVCCKCIKANKVELA
jgi:large subunit ribosomal protein L28